MIFHRISRLVFVFGVFLLGLQSFDRLQAQSSLGYHWYVNVNGGISQLYGDIQKSNNPIDKLDGETTYGFGLRLGKYLGPVFNLHGQFYRNEMKGYDEASDRKCFSNLAEYQLGTTINLTNLVFGKKERRINLYGTTGIAAIFFRSEALTISTNQLIEDYGYSDDEARKESTRLTGFSFPVGAGLDFKLADRWYINLESVMRFTTTDKLDARVAGSNNDAYYYSSLGISYNFMIKESEKLIEAPPEITADPFANENVDLVYDIPSNLKSNEEFILKSIIHKGKITGPGRLIQILPIGLNVLDSVIAGGRPEIINYTLYLNWDELPTDSVFEVSYRVKPDKIYGTLPMVSNLYLQRTGKEYKFRYSMTIERVEEVIPPVEPEPVAVKKDTIAPARDVEYRVQITAGYKSKISIETLTKKYGLDVDFKEDCLGNWCHYSVGSFATYEEAREYRNMLISKHGARDAFIVAFFQGKRLNQLSELKDIPSVTLPIVTVYKESGYCYRVQILAVYQKSANPETLREMHNIEEEVNEEVYHNWRKYTVGKCTSMTEAKSLLQKMKSKGITDSFISHI